MSGVYFCAGEYCPGFHWPASNTPHPTSCALERLNSAENLREIAKRRGEHGRLVRFAIPDDESDYDSSTFSPNHSGRFSDND